MKPGAGRKQQKREHQWNVETENYVSFKSLLLETSTDVRRSEFKLFGPATLFLLFTFVFWRS